MNTDSIRKYLNDHIKESRLEHIDGVRKTAIELAEIYGADKDKAEMAALLHDMCKWMTQNESDIYVEKYGLNNSFIGNRNLAHGPLAAIMAKEDFGIEDSDIINAVRYHTVGRQGMSLLEKIIYIADAVEPGRNYPGVYELRKTAYSDLDRACLISLEKTEEHVRENGLVSDSNTLKAIEYFKLKIKGENMNIKEKAMIAAELLDRRKAADIEIIDISDKSSFADYFVIATGGSERQVKALADDVQDEYAKEEIFPKSVEGKYGSGWILLDYNDVIINVFTEEMRAKYSLEKIWGDCEFIDLED